MYVDGIHSAKNVKDIVDILKKVSNILPCASDASQERFVMFIYILLTQKIRNI